MKKIVLLLMTVVLLGVLSACAQNAGVQASASGSATASASARTATATATPKGQRTALQKTSTAAADQTGGGVQSQGNPPFPLRSVRMVDASNGWALTGAAVWRTSNGGLHWTNVSPPLGTINELSSGAFHDMLRAWIVTPPIYNSTTVPQGTVLVLRTVDGGTHWRETRLYDAQAVSVVGPPNFINLEQGWIEVGAGTAAGHESVDLFASYDSGESWRKVATSAYPPNGQLSLEGDKTGISFRDAYTGWATGMTSATDQPWLYVTHDGGSYWLPQALPLVPGLSNAFYQTTPPVLLGSYGLLPVLAGDGTRRGTVFYVTYDGGAHWAPRTLSAFVAQTVYVVDGLHAWASDSSTCYATADGGYSWVARSHLAGVTEFSFINTMQGWAIEGNDSHANLYHTLDGGRTWQPIAYTMR